MKYFTSVPLGLYNDESNDIPGGAIRIDDELYQKLIIGQATGSFIQADENGNPILIDEVSLSHEQQVIQAMTQKKLLLTRASEEISWRQDAFEMGIATEEEIRMLKSWREYRVMLMRVDVSTHLEINWPHLP